MTPNENLNLDQASATDFRCFCCGICCREYQVRLEMAEAVRLAADLGLSLPEFTKRYTDPAWPGKESLLLRQEGGNCIFLEIVDGNPATRCTIYPNRPRDCREWRPSSQRSECQRGLVAWGLNVTEDSKITGTIDSLARFNRFLRSLA